MASARRMEFGQSEIDQTRRWLRRLESALVIDCRRASALVDPQAPGNPRALASVRRALAKPELVKRALLALAKRALAKPALVKRAPLALAKRALAKRAPGEARTVLVRWRFASGR